MISESVKDLDLNRLTTRNGLVATTLEANGANWAIRNAATKFTPEQRKTIRENAREDYLRDALAKVRSSRDA